MYFFGAKFKNHHFFGAKISKLRFFGANFVFFVHFGMRRKVEFLATVQWEKMPLFDAYQNTLKTQNSRQKT